MKNNFNAKKGISQRVMDLIKPLLSTSKTYSGESPLIKKGFRTPCNDGF